MMFQRSKPPFIVDFPIKTSTEFDDIPSDRNLNVVRGFVHCHV
jgi:hypothetical protein